jgi:uncharacterized protein
VNLLLALGWQNHPQHQVARAWFAKEAVAGWATCLHTQAGFLRLSMNPHIVGVSIHVNAAMVLLSGLTAHPSHRFAEMTQSLTSEGFAALTTKVQGHRQVADMTLLFIARINGLRLVTFDGGIRSVNPWPENLCAIEA